MGGTARTSGAPGSSTDVMAPFVGQGPTATLPGPSGRTREGLSSRGATGRVASSRMLPPPVGDRDRLVRHARARLAAREAAPPILRAPMAPCLESTDSRIAKWLSE